MENKISFENFKKVEIKVGKILSIEKVENTDKLLKLIVDFGISKTIKKNEDGEEITEEKKDVRQIISGIALFFEDINILLNNKYAFITNLEERTIKGLRSESMILAAFDKNNFSLLALDNKIQEGTIIS